MQHAGFFYKNSRCFCIGCFAYRQNDLTSLPLLQQLRKQLLHQPSGCYPCNVKKIYRYKE